MSDHQHTHQHSDQKLTCVPVSLQTHLLMDAAKRATRINPRNRPHPLAVPSASTGPSAASAPLAMRIAVVTNKYWHAGGKDFSVYFMDNPPFPLRNKILSHMNAWATHCNVSFRETGDPGGEVRISRAEGGYWSYIGTDILSIAQDQQTMNLEGFTMQTEESEFYRVVRHETGHTLGCPHEHMRQQLIDLIDVDAAIAYFQANQGWDAATTRQQVLTPLDQSSIMGTPDADQDSIMCYQIPGSITKSGEPILGGTDIDVTDYDFMAGIYPKPDAGATTGEAGDGGATQRGRPARPSHGRPQSGRMTVARAPSGAGAAEDSASGVLVQLPSGVDLTLPAETVGDILDRLFPPSPAPRDGEANAGTTGALPAPAPPVSAPPASVVPASPTTAPPVQPASAQRTRTAGGAAAHAPVAAKDVGGAEPVKIITQSTYAKAIMDAGVAKREQDAAHHDVPATGQYVRNCVLGAIGALEITATNKPGGAAVEGHDAGKVGPQADKIVASIARLHAAPGGQISIVFIGEAHDSAGDHARAQDLIAGLSKSPALNDVVLVLERGLKYDIPADMPTRIREETLTSIPNFNFGVDKLEPDNRTIAIAGYLVAYAASGDQGRNIVFVVLCGDRHADLAQQFEYLATSAGRFGVDWVAKRPRSYCHAPTT